jgi:hypothetical protein
MGLAFASRVLNGFQEFCDNDTGELQAIGLFAYRTRTGFAYTSMLVLLPRTTDSARLSSGPAVEKKRLRIRGSQRISSQ